MCVRATETTTKHSPPPPKKKSLEDWHDPPVPQHATAFKANSQKSQTHAHTHVMLLSHRACVHAGPWRMSGPGAGTAPPFCGCDSFCTVVAFGLFECSSVLFWKWHGCHVLLGFFFFKIVRFCLATTHAVIFWAALQECFRGFFFYIAVYS